MSRDNFRSGCAALIGRPNAGKSTLLNRLVGEKIAAVSNKPQTTRHKIQGIVSREDGQIVFVDTPGVHKPGYQLNRRMMSAVHDAVLSVDLLVLMRDASVSTGNGDRFVLDLVKRSEKPAVLVLNKIDKIKEKNNLLPLIDWYSKEYDFKEIVPVSALKGDAIDNLLDQIVRHLPENDRIFPEDELTDQPMRTLVAEMVREKILATTGEEIPYVTAVVTEVYDETARRLAAMTDAEGRPLKVMRMPSPGWVESPGGGAAPASHMNFVIANAAVIAPIYEERPGELALQALEALFPGRTVIGLPSRALLTGGGSFHCITQQEPA